MNNWSGTPGTGGGTDEIFVGSSATGLSAAQLAKIQFTGFTGIKLLGTGEVVPLTASAQFLLGDINQDNHVNGSDITAMLTALTNLNAYRAAHPTLTDANVLSIADINGDGKWNNADIQFLIGYLQAGHGSAAAVPEPATLILAVVGLLAGLTIRRGSRLPLDCQDYACTSSPEPGGKLSEEKVSGTIFDYYGEC